ncbi:MAG: anthranilate phosphoribosyltransferase [Pseudomonadota bacterium]
MTSPFTPYLQQALSRDAVSAEDITTAFDIMLKGEVDPIQAGAFLAALKVRGETQTEIAAAATAMRATAISFEGPDGAVDTCGTGGDGANTYNISTATAIVLAACDVPVAKHGNKAVSSASGSSDVLSALGVDISISPDKAEACLNAIGIAFLFAPNHHPAVKHVAPVRAALGVRTLFNLLGPLTNPAGARRQLLGVYDKSLMVPIAETLKALGAVSAWVVHGDDGLDELTVTGPSHVAILRDGSVVNRTLTPAEAGLSRHDADALVGGDATTNADALRALLDGDKNAYRDAVLLNAAAGLIVAGKDEDLAPGAQRAAHAIDSGAAKEKLNALIQYTAS